MLQTNDKDLWTSKPVFIASKKKIQKAYLPNSYRIFQDGISDKNVARPATTSEPRVQSGFDRGMSFRASKPSNYWGTTASHESLKSHPGYIKDHPREPTRRNCPHPASAKFLRSNVRILNDAIPMITTDDSTGDQHNWWQTPQKNSTPTTSTSSKSGLPLLKKNHQKPSTADWTNATKRVVRHKPPPSSDWILKHNSSDDKKFLEHISYRHGYNRRWYRNEPIRGKLPGNFVWQEM